MAIILTLTLFFFVLIFFVSATDFRIYNIFSTLRPPIIKAALNKKPMTPRPILSLFFTRFIKSRLSISSVIDFLCVGVTVYFFSILTYALFTGSNFAYCLNSANNLLYIPAFFFKQLSGTTSFFSFVVLAILLLYNFLLFSSVGRYFFNQSPRLLKFLLVIDSILIGLAAVWSFKGAVVLLIQYLGTKLNSKENFSSLEFLQFCNLISFNESNYLIPTHLLWEFIFLLILINFLFYWYTQFTEENYNGLALWPFINFTQKIRRFLYFMWFLPFSVLWFANGLWFGPLFSVLCLGFLALSIVYKIILFTTLRYYPIRTTIFSNSSVSILLLILLLIVSSVGLCEMASAYYNWICEFNSLPIFASRSGSMRLTESISNFDLIYQQFDVASSRLNFVSQFNGKVSSLISDLLGWLINDYLVLLDYTAHGGWISKDLVEYENYLINDTGAHRFLPEHEVVFQTPLETSGEPSLALLWSDSHLYGTFYVRIGRATALHWKSIYWLALDSHSNAVISTVDAPTWPFYTPGIPWSLGMPPVLEQSGLVTSFNKFNMNPVIISDNDPRVHTNLIILPELGVYKLKVLDQKINNIKSQLSSLKLSAESILANLRNPDYMSQLDSRLVRRVEKSVKKCENLILDLNRSIQFNRSIHVNLKKSLEDLFLERDHKLSESLNAVFIAKTPVTANLQTSEMAKLDWLLTRDWAFRKGVYAGSLLQKQELRLVELSNSSRAYMIEHGIEEKRAALRSLLDSAASLEHGISNDHIDHSAELLVLLDSIRTLHTEVRHHNLTLEAFELRHAIVQATVNNFKSRLPLWKGQYSAASPNQILSVENFIKKLQEDAASLREVYDAKKALLAEARDNYFTKQKVLLTELHINAKEYAHFNTQKITLQAKLVKLQAPQLNFLSKRLENIKDALKNNLTRLAEYTQYRDQLQALSIPRDNVLLAKKGGFIPKKGATDIDALLHQVHLRIRQTSLRLSDENKKLHNLTKVRSELLDQHKAHLNEIADFNSFNLRYELLKAKNTQELSKVTRELKSNLDELEALEKLEPSTVDFSINAEQGNLDSIVVKLSNLSSEKQQLDEERQTYISQMQTWDDRMRLHADRLALIQSADQQGKSRIQVLQKEADAYAIKHDVALRQNLYSKAPVDLANFSAQLQHNEHKLQLMQARVDSLNFLIATYSPDASEIGLRNLHDELFFIRKAMQPKISASVRLKNKISRVEANVKSIQRELSTILPKYNDYLSKIAAEEKVLELKLQRLRNSNLIVTDQESTAEKTRLHFLKVRLDDENTRIIATEKSLMAARDDSQSRLIVLTQSKSTRRQEAIAFRQAMDEKLELRHKSLTEEMLVLDTFYSSRSAKKLYLQRQSLSLQAKLKSFDASAVNLKNNISSAMSELKKLLSIKNNLLSMVTAGKTDSKTLITLEGTLARQLELGGRFIDKPKYPLFKGDPKEALDDFIKGKIFLPEPVLPGRMQPAIISTQKHPSTNVTGHMQEELLEFINAHWPYAGLSGVSSRSTPLPAIFDFNTSTLIEPINKWLSVVFNGSLLFTGWSFFPYGDYILLFLRAMVKLFYSKLGLVSYVNKYYITDFIPNSVINYNHRFWTLTKLVLYHIWDFKTTFFPNVIGVHRIKRTVYPLPVRLAWVSLGQSGLIMLIIFLGLLASPFMLTPVSGYKGSMAPATRITRRYQKPYQPLWSLVARSHSGFFFSQFFLLWFFVFVLRILLLLSFNMLAGFTLAEWSGFAWKHEHRQKLHRSAEVHFAEAWSGYAALQTRFLFNNFDDLAVHATSRTRLHRQLLHAIKLHRDPSSRPRAANRKEAKKAVFKTFLRRYYSFRSLYFAHFDSRAELTRLYLRDWSTQQLGYGQSALQPNPILSAITPLEYAALNPINQRITRLNYILARSGLSFTSPASLESVYAQTPLGAVRRGKSRKTAGIDALNKLGTFASVDAEGFAMRPAFKSRLWVKFHSTHRLGSQSRRLLSPVIDIIGPYGGLINRLSQTVIPQSFSYNQQKHPRVLHNFKVHPGRSSYYGFFNSIVGSELNEKYFEEGIIFKKPKRTKGLTLYNEDRSNFTRQTNLMHRFFIHRRFRAPRYGANLRNYYAKGPFKYSFSLRQHYGRHYLRRGERLTFSSWFTDRLLINNFYSINFIPFKYGPVVITQHWPARFFNLFYTPKTVVIRPHLHDTDIISSSGTDLMSIARGHPPNRQFRTRGQSLGNRSKLANKPLSKTPSIFTIPLIEDRYLQNLDSAQIRIILRRLSVLEAHYSVELASLLHGRKGSSAQRFHSADVILHRASINTRTHAKWLAWSADAHSELLRARVRVRKTKKLTATIAEWCHPLLPKMQSRLSVSFDKEPFTITSLVPLLFSDKELFVTFRLLKKSCLEPSLVSITTKVGAITSTENLVNMGFGIIVGVLTLTLTGFYS